MTVRKTKVLLVEDELADIEFTQYAFERGELDHMLTVCQTGQAAVEVLRETLGTPDFPDLVLLDVNLPDMTGMDVLGQIRSDEGTRKLPVIVLSTSNFSGDVDSAYNRLANAYVRKPIRLAGFEDLVRAIEYFWFGQAILPSK